LTIALYQVRTGGAIFHGKRTGAIFRVSDLYRKALCASAAGGMILNKPTSLYRNFLSKN
jgi:hypothetical protein